MERKWKRRLENVAISILMLSMMFFCFVLIGCDTNKDARLNYSMIRANDLSIDWVLPTDYIYDSNNLLYRVTYNGSNFAEGLGINNNQDGNITLTITDEDNNKVNEITNAGRYTITADYIESYEGEKNNLIDNVITVEVLRKSVNVVWAFDEELISGNVHAVTYNTIDFLSKISATITGIQEVSLNAKDSTSADVEEIINVGSYTVTARIQGENSDNYELSNPSITLNVEKADVDITWSYKYNDNDPITLDQDSQIVYCASDISIIPSYTLNNTKYNLSSISITNGNGQNVGKVRNIGEYFVSVNTASEFYNINFANTIIEFDVIKKDIYLIADSYEIDYLGQIKDTEALTFSIYDTYNEEEGTGNKLENWDDELSANLSYNKENEEITIDDIITERDSWVYSEEDYKRTYDITLTYNSEDYTNYNIVAVVNGEFSIILKEITLTLNNQSNVETKKVHQTEVVNITSWLNGKGVIGDTITNWYIDGVERVGEQSFVSNTILYCYPIYRIYYMNTEDVNNKDSANIINKGGLKYHKYLNQTLPDRKHITIDGNLLEPTKYAYNFQNWINGTRHYSYLGSKLETDNLSGDIYLYPHFLAKSFNIDINIMTDGDFLRGERKTYNITDYDNKKEYTLSKSEIEGYEFIGWFYNNKKIEEVITISDFIPNRLDVDTYDSSNNIRGNIVIEARYELYKCSVSLVVGDKTISTESYEPGSRINKDYLYSLIDRKFGFIYFLSDVPEEANVSVIVVRVTEFPLLWVVVGVAIVATTITVVVIKSIRKRKNDIDKNKLDVILNRLNKK